MFLNTQSRVDSLFSPDPLEVELEDSLFDTGKSPAYILKCPGWVVVYPEKGFGVFISSWLRQSIHILFKTKKEKW